MRWPCGPICGIMTQCSSSLVPPTSTHLPRDVADIKSAERAF